jgi:ubiquinone/menaquinone biosynthesis C-methylase UbiE
MVHFNWPDYLLASAALVLGVAIVRLTSLPQAAVVAIVLGGSVAAWFIVASLVAGWWIYDRSALYDWSWVVGLLGTTPRRWANVTVGFDESSTRLQELVGGDTTTIDVFDATRMTESSIRRARASRQPLSGTVSCGLERLPFSDGSLDAAFVIFAAHELRRATDREVLFTELARSVRGGGRVVLVEHPRTMPNILAFGPGAMHFLPREEWLRVARRAGFECLQRRSMTRFVEAVVLERRS